MSIVTIAAEVAAIERERKAKAISHAILCRESGVDRDTWRDARRGVLRPRADTIARLQTALAGVRAAPAPSVIAATVRLAMMWLARETGADVDVMMAQDFSAERPQNAAWLRAAQLRRYAVYVAAVELQVKNPAIAKALHCSRQNIKQARDQVEDRREDPAIEELLERCAVLVKGRAE